MSNSKIKNDEKKFEERQYKFKGLNGIEKVYLDERTTINMEAEEDYPLYKSVIAVSGKEFDVYIKFNLGRLTSGTFIHIIVTSEGHRASLGFVGYIGKAIEILNNYIYKAVSKQ